MERQVISKRIGEVLEDISRLSNTLYALNLTDLQRYPENYELLSTDAALRAESIACRLRHLIYSSTSLRKPEYLSSAGVIHGIRIEQRGGIMEITVPGLMPKRKKKRTSEFITDPLYFTLEQYAVTHKMPRFRHCVVCFSHIYCRDLPTRRIRDYDNLELKQILDVITSYIMQDDGGLLCDAYNTTELGEADCMRVSVMDKDRFPEWLADRENYIESITDF